MHYISLWEMDDLARLTRQRPQIRKGLRGYNMRPVPPELRSPSISVSDLANSICTTHRDIYFAKVLSIRRNPLERPWEAEAGTIIHSLLQAIHHYVKRMMASSRATLDGQVLFRRIKSFGQKTKVRLLSHYKNDTRFAGVILANLDSQCDRIIFFEALLTCSLLIYKASKKTILATGSNVVPLQEFEQLFNFSAIEHTLSPAYLGLTQSVTPDFIYANRIIGDIKTGVPHEDTFLLTCVAYAVAYEAEYKRDIDFGVILHVNTSANHPFPIYQAK